ncbi:MAG TPA: DUF1501 domain-containing protein, partial [Verrucomicrobiae bacterium]|nr:DUF1501 domain-containing protein [Verrucomicrobiae bacterium]
MVNVINRRRFLDQSMKASLGVALSTLVNIPLVMKQALAQSQGSIGRNGKKFLFVFLRGANDGLNSLIPIQDSAYNLTNRPTLMIPKDPGTDYSALGACDFPASGANPTFGFANAIRTGNGFAALHPSLKFLAPVYNAGDLALIHRVAYPRQSRSHFDSQNYWENGAPGSNTVKDGMFYRAMFESGLANSSPLTGVSIQSALPLSLRGSKAPMTNLSDPANYDLLGVPVNTGNNKSDAALRTSVMFDSPPARNRDLLDLQYRNLTDTLSIFSSLNFADSGNTFVDDENTDGDKPYYLFPTTNAKNGGGNAAKYVVDTGGYGFMTDLKAAAMVLNKTDAIMAGTEMGGFDTHNNQGALTGQHPNLNKRIAWMMYGLRKYFTKYADKATWNNLVVVTLSEFGRTTVENSTKGTDHAEGSVMFVGGGAVKGYGKGNSTGIFGCHPNDKVPWVTGQTGSMFGASNRYVKRAVDYRSVLGEIIRDHLGATQDQLNR